jgi:hypothetical protein
MHLSKSRFFLVLLSFYLLCVAAPAFASSGEVDIYFLILIVVAFFPFVVTTLSAGLLCGAAELIGVLYRPPLWIGWTAVGLSLPGLALVFGMEKSLFVILAYLQKSSATLILFLLEKIVSGLVYLLPALISLALVTFLPVARRRLIAIWSIAIGISVWGIFQARQGKHAGYSSQLILLNVSVSMLMWQVAFVLGQRQSRSADIPPTPGPDLRRLMGKVVDVGGQVYANPPPWLGRLMVKGVAGGRQVYANLPLWRGRLIERGVLWWLGGAVAYYVAIPILAAFGHKSLLWTMQDINELIGAIVGFGPSSFSRAKDMGGWAVNGLAWSVMVGIGIWGAAAITRCFEAGRLAPFRLAAFVLPLCLLLWVAGVANVKY